MKHTDLCQLLLHYTGMIWILNSMRAWLGLDSKKRDDWVDLVVGRTYDIPTFRGCRLSDDGYALIIEPDHGWIKSIHIEGVTMIKEQDKLIVNSERKFDDNLIEIAKRIHEITIDKGL